MVCKVIMAREPRTVIICRGHEGLCLGHQLPSLKRCYLAEQIVRLGMKHQFDALGFSSICKGLSNILSTQPDNMIYTHLHDAYTQQAQKAPWEQFTCFLLSPFFIKIKNLMMFPVSILRSVTPLHGQNRNASFIEFF